MINLVAGLCVCLLDALSLLGVASSDVEAILVARGVGCVGALVVLDVTRADESGPEVVEGCVTLNLECIAICGDGRSTNATKLTSEGLNVTSVVATGVSLSRRGLGSWLSVASSVSTGVASVVSSVASVVTSVVTSVSGVVLGLLCLATTNDTALIVNLLDVDEVGLDTEDSVEGISLGARSNLSGGSGSTSLLADILCLLVSAAGVGQSVADELGDDADILSRSVVERGLVSGLEGGLATTIDSCSEADLRGCAASKVGTSASVSGVSARGGRGRSGRGSGCSIGGGCSRGSSAVVRAARNNSTLVVNDSVISKVGGDAKDSVEGISLDTSLRRGSTSSGSLSLGAEVLCSLVGAAGVSQLVAHRTGDDVDVLG